MNEEINSKSRKLIVIENKLFLQKHLSRNAWRVLLESVVCQEKKVLMKILVSQQEQWRANWRVGGRLQRNNARLSKQWCCWWWCWWWWWWWWKYGFQKHTTISNICSGCKFKIYDKRESSRISSTQTQYNWKRYLGWFSISSEIQLDLRKLIQFPRFNTNHPTDNSIYRNFMQDLRKKFEIRFVDMHSKKTDFSLISQPFDVELDSAKFSNGINWNAE